MPEVVEYLIYWVNYVPNSAGVLCGFQLAHELNERGHKTYMTGIQQTHPSLNAPIMRPSRAAQLLQQPDSKIVVIYPETVTGNPLNAPRVARWVLNKPGHLGGEKVYAPTEKVFYYSELYRDSIQNEIAGKLYMPVLDEKIFYATGCEVRDIECFYVGKGKLSPYDKIDPSKVMEITRWSPPKRILGDLLRHTKVLYTFDNYTALIHEALMCGCPVVLIPEHEKVMEDIAKQECGSHGIFLMEQGVPEGFKVDIELVKTNNERIKAEWGQQLDNFIKITREMVVCQPKQRGR